jgi:hypothetical protein
VESICFIHVIKDFFMSMRCESCGCLCIRVTCHHEMRQEIILCLHKYTNCINPVRSISIIPSTDDTVVFQSYHIIFFPRMFTHAMISIIQNHRLHQIRCLRNLHKYTNSVRSISIIPSTYGPVTKNTCVNK